MDITTVEKKAGLFLTAHHAILYAVLAVAIVAGVYLFVSDRANVAETKAQAAETALAVEKDRSAQLAAIYAANEAQRQAERAAALLAIQQAQSQAKVQIIHDQQLLAPELGHRIETITGFKQGSVTLSGTDDLIVPLPLARDIVGRLDQGLADAQTVSIQAGIINSHVKTIDDLKGIVAEDKVVLTKQIETDKKVLDAEIKKNRKSKLKWFGAGVVVGFVGRQFVKF
jgi:hypothetical protein